VEHCRSLSAKEPLIIGLYNQWPLHPMASVNTRKLRATDYRALLWNIAGLFLKREPLVIGLYNQWLLCTKESFAGSRL